MNKDKIRTKRLYVSKVGKLEKEYTYDGIRCVCRGTNTPIYVLVKKNIFSNYVDIFSKRRYISFEKASNMFFKEAPDWVLLSSIPLITAKKYITYSEATELLENCYAHKK